MSHPSTPPTLLLWQEELLALVADGFTRRPSAELETITRARGINLHSMAVEVSKSHGLGDSSADWEAVATELLVAGITSALIVDRLPRLSDSMPSIDLDLPDVYRLHAAGHSPTVIADTVTTSRARVYWLLKKRGLSANPHKDRSVSLSAKQRDLILRAWEAGEALTAVASRLGVSIAQVRYLIGKERKRLLTPSETAARLGVTEGFLTHLVDNGHLPRSLDGPLTKYAVVDIERYEKANTVALGVGRRG